MKNKIFLPGNIRRVILGKTALLLALTILLGSNLFAIDKKIVFISWYTAEMRPASIVENIDYIEALPFDGITISADQAFDVMAPGYTCDYNTVSASMNMVKDIFTTLTDNYAMVYVKKPGDFFDDEAWNLAIANWGIFARAAKEAGLKGICFDNEPYFEGQRPWGYPDEVDHPNQYTLQQYRDQARLRGNQVMQACLNEFPDIKIWSFHGPYVGENTLPSGFQTQMLDWKLMGSFFVGMVEPTVGTSAINVDGGEIYSLRTLKQFQTQYDWNKYTIQSEAQNSPNISAALRPYWSDRVEKSFGVYLSLAFPEGDNMDETILGPTLENALSVVDDFVWLYVEETQNNDGWLTPAGSSAMAPYLAAITGAKNAVNTGDIVAPSVPTDLTSASVAAANFNLSWTASTDDVGVTIYEVFKDGVAITSTSSTSIWVTNLAASTTYSMTVRARDAAFNWSAQSIALSITTEADTQAPSVPKGLASYSVTATNFTLRWTASTDNVGVTGYEVFQDGTSIGTTTETSMSITGLTEATAYSMTVKARDATGNWSAASTALLITTTEVDALAPSAPTGLASSKVTIESFNLIWTASTDNFGVTGYEVFQDGVSIGTTTKTYISIIGLTIGTTYSMTVKARDATGNWSAASPAFYVTTLFNMIANPGFESGAVNWGFNGNGGLNLTQARTGSKCWTLGPDYAMAAQSYVAPGFAVGDSLTVSGWAKYAQATTAFGDFGAICFDVLDAQTGIFFTKFDNVDTTYAQKSVTFIVPSNTAKIMVFFETYEVIMYFDDFALVNNSHGVGVDTLTPSVPTGLASSNVTETSFTLSWTASTDNVGVNGYEVFKNGESAGTTALTSMEITGLADSEVYSMTVRAHDNVPNWSEQSTALSVTTLMSGLDDASARVKQMKLFPNPASASDGNINLSLVGFDENKQVKITVNDLTGKVVYTSNRSVHDTRTLPINNLKSGVYIIKAEADEIIMINKLIIK